MHGRLGFRFAAQPTEKGIEKVHNTQHVWHQDCSYASTADRPSSDRFQMAPYQHSTSKDPAASRGSSAILGCIVGPPMTRSTAEAAGVCQPIPPTLTKASASGT